ncbi:SWIM zinc finger family protein [Aquabacterium sp. A7-Y]|uniref:SWIM zinc finger family protein n=1 Tax=Aquabacterium sp. A7-Y TaxID=1349605 RepID=UPI00223DE80E|nr:SWIM zinc finger family protein [Aquabacterium sp. A7-Y]MCW7539001.1 SWIM zinc finger family protein [Aquabacterium sp. A7-Y]
MTLTAEAVLALAPDDTSAKAARGLVAPAKWPTVGADAAAVWGECQGSGSKPYQTQVDLNGPAFRCSCPSRKFPCKHGLALLLMRAADPARFQGAAQPAWVSEWLQSRADKAEKKEQKAQAGASAPADPEAAAKRSASRWDRMAHAGEELQRWLCDQASRGLGGLSDAQRGEWKTLAARLVDMQVPGLAQRVLDAAERIGQGSDWPEHLLTALGSLQLACDALKRRETLSPALRAELRTVLGWPFDKSEVMAEGEPVRDCWLVLGQITEERAGRLSERRVWLQGASTGRRVLLLDHAYAGRGFEQGWLTGQAHDATVVFFPGASRLRALIGQLHGSAEPVLPAVTSWQDEWQLLADRVAASPWTELHPLVLADVVPVREGETWRLLADGRALTLVLSEADGWLLLAHCGGRPARLMGEWNGNTLRPLAAWNDDGLWQRGGDA